MVAIPTASPPTEVTDMPSSLSPKVFAKTWSRTHAGGPSQKTLLAYIGETTEWAPLFAPDRLALHQREFCATLSPQVARDRIIRVRICLQAATRLIPSCRGFRVPALPPLPWERLPASRAWRSSLPPPVSARPFGRTIGHHCSLGLSTGPHSRL